MSDQLHAPAAFYPRYPLDRRLGGPQSRSGHRGYRKNRCLYQESNLDRPVVQSVVRHYIDSYSGSFSLCYSLTVRPGGYVKQQVTCWCLVAGSALKSLVNILFSMVNDLRISYPGNRCVLYEGIRRPGINLLKE
jgi:hypothetical protein